MQPEYEAIVAAGFVLQLDCPDLAMAHHTSFQDLSEDEFLKRAAFHVEALNHALRNIPAEMCRMHICWGNYEGPHDHDIDFAKVPPILSGRSRWRWSFEAANPRHAHEWTVWRDLKLPDDKILVPGVLDTSTNYVEHPELVAERLVPLRRHRRPRAGHRGQRLRLRHLRRLRQARPRHLVQEAARDGRRRGDCLQAVVGPGLTAALSRCFAELRRSNLQADQSSHATGHARSGPQRALPAAACSPALPRSRASP